MKSGAGSPAFNMTNLLPSLGLIPYHAVAFRAQHPSLTTQQLEVGKGLVGRGHHLEAVVGRDGEGLQRDLVAGPGPAADRVEHGELAYPVEVDELARPAAMVVVDGAVGRADQPRLVALDLLVRGEEVAE